jgi:hypothetical protein
MRGHTDAMMLPVIPYRDSAVVFMADLIPSVAHIPVPYVMAYDTRPLITMTEKKAFLETALRNRWKLFFEHDPKTECCSLKATERGIRAEATFRLMEI